MLNYTTTSFALDEVNLGGALARSTIPASAPASCCRAEKLAEETRVKR
jgi:hypothetical protein